VNFLSVCIGTSSTSTRYELRECPQESGSSSLLTSQDEKGDDLSAVDF